MAERGGFEPPIRLHVCRISSAVHSTTLPPLRPLPRRSGPSCSKVSRRWGRRASGWRGFKSTEALVGALRARRSLIKAGAACTRAPRHDFRLKAAFRAREELRGHLLRRRATERRRSSCGCAMAGRPRRSRRNCSARVSRGSPRVTRVQATCFGARCRTTYLPSKKRAFHGGSRAGPSAVSYGVSSPVAGRTGRAALATPRLGVAQAA